MNHAAWVGLSATQSERPRSRRRSGVCVALLSALAVTGSVQLAAPAAAAGPDATFYVSPSGDDAADGRTAQTAWRTLQRANGRVFAPGETLLLAGGAAFTGPLYFDAADAGDPARPVVVGSYGTGRATIVATASAGVNVYNTASITLRDLDIVGQGSAYRAQSGISLYNDLAGGRRLANVRVAGVDVSGFKIGIALGGGRGASGFADVLVSDSTLHDNMEAGFISYGPAFDPRAPSYAHTGVHLLRVQARTNLGDPDNLVRNTGNGIVLGSVSGGMVEHSVAQGNGARCRAPEGPAGIWAYDSTRVVLRHNVSFSNRSGGPADGDGFDLDQNVSASVMEGNLSYDNDGAGYLLWAGSAEKVNSGNVVRYNISRSDGRRLAWYGGITVGGWVRDAHVYANTVVMGGDRAGAPALRLGGTLDAVAVRNNVLSTLAGGAVVNATDARLKNVLLQGNNYASGESAFSAAWAGRSYATLAAFRKGTGQELLNGQPTGSAGNPALRDPSVPWQVASAEQLSTAVGFHLAAGSPMRGRGLDLAQLFGTAVGGRDFFGTVVASRPAASDIGAHQPSAGQVTAAATSTSSTSTTSTKAPTAARTTRAAGPVGQRGPWKAR